MTDLLTALQAAAIVGCSRETIVRNLTPVIPSHKGSAHLFNRADVEEFNRTWTRGIKQLLKDAHKRYVINPTSHTRQRKPRGIALYLAMREVVKKRPDLEGVIE